MVSRYLKGEGHNNAAMQQKIKSADVVRFENVLADYLGTAVSIKANAKNKGYLQISFENWVHLNDLLERQGLHKLLAEN